MNEEERPRQWPQERILSEFVPFFSSAIQQMHVKNIVHFDLQSKNISQCNDDVWKVADVDLAK